MGAARAAGRRGHDPHGEALGAADDASASAAAGLLSLPKAGSATARTGHNANAKTTSAFCLLQVCTDLAAHRMPLDPDLYLASPADDLAALAAPAWLATAREHPGKLQPLLAALLPLLQAKLDAAQQMQQVQRAGKPGRAAAKAGGPFQSAAVKPRPDPQAEQRELSEAELTQQVRRLLQQLQRALPGQQAKRRQERTAAAFQEAEARAKRQRQ